MKRFILLALVAAFVLGGAAFAGATELKVSGEFQVNADFSDNVPNFMSSKNASAVGFAKPGDPFSIHQRMRNYFTFVSSENLKAVWGVEIGTGYWGRANGQKVYNQQSGNASSVGSSINTTSTTGTAGAVTYAAQIGAANNVGNGAGFGFDGDGVNVETKWAYLDFNVPGTVLNVKAGLLPATLPNAFGPGSMVMDADVPAVVLTAAINDMFSVVAGYTRFIDLNIQAENAAQNDEMDAVFLAIPITPVKGITATPWGAWGQAGRDLYEPTWSNSTVQQPNAATGVLNSVAPASSNTLGLLAPVNLTNVQNIGTAANPYYRVNGASETTTVWWAGLAYSMKMFDPFVFDADFIYGAEKNSGLSIDRSGWMADARLQYKGLGPIGTPNLFGMYSSGENDNSFNVAGATSTGNRKSERMPFLYERWQIPGSFWYGGSAFDVTGSSSGKISDYNGMSNPIGTWVAGAGLYGMSFLEGLTHDVVFLYAQGTNNRNSVPMLRQQGFGIGTAMTTKDSLWEVDFNHQYQIYEQLQAIVELGMIIPSYNKGIGWVSTINADGTISNNNSNFKLDNAWRVLFGLKYKY